MKRLSNMSYETPLDSHKRSVEKMASKYELSEVYDEGTQAKAWDLLLRSSSFPTWDAALRWIVSHESHEKVTWMIEKIGANLHIRRLQDLDYRLYCPQWWRDAMDQPVD